jgi:hypothetical protein
MGRKRLICLLIGVPQQGDSVGRSLSNLLADWGIINSRQSVPDEYFILPLTPDPGYRVLGL